jgi:VanZ family protein
MMFFIFLASARPSDRLPVFGDWDIVLKKLSHAVGFGMLAAAYVSALLRPTKPRAREAPAGESIAVASKTLRTAWLAWGLAVLYAATDEYHQSFVAGRHASVLDIGLFDAPGAVAGIWFWFRWKRRRGQPAAPLPGR